MPLLAPVTYVLQVTCKHHHIVAIETHKGAVTSIISHLIIAYIRKKFTLHKQQWQHNYAVYT